MSEHYAIEADKVCKRIRDKTILDSVSFRVPENSVYALAGHNGAGKSTIIRILLGLDNRYTGKISFFGSGDLAAGRKKTGAFFDGSGLPGSKTGYQYLKEVCLICGCDHRKAVPEAAAFTEAEPYLKKTINTYSFGMKQRLAFAAALIGDPQLLILDEPFNGIDAQGMGHIRVMLGKLHSKGTTIIITSHILSELSRIATHYGIMAEGRFIGETDATRLRSMNVTKRVITVTDQADCIETINTGTRLFAVAEGENSVSVFGAADGLPDYPHTGEKTEKAEPEEILLWYMSGKVEGLEKSAESKV